MWRCVSPELDEGGSLLQACLQRRCLESQYYQDGRLTEGEVDSLCWGLRECRPQALLQSEDQED
jgi:hypothetical protein